MSKSIQLLGNKFKPSGQIYILPRSTSKEKYKNLSKAYNSRNKKQKFMKTFKKYNIYIYCYDNQSKQYYIDWFIATSKSSKYIFFLKTKYKLLLMWHKKRGKKIFNIDNSIVKSINKYHKTQLFYKSNPCPICSTYKTKEDGTKCYYCTMKLLKNAETYDEFVDLSVLSLMGKLVLYSSGTPSDPIVLRHSESGDQGGTEGDDLNKIIKLNKLRFVTIDSQKGLIEYKKPTDKDMYFKERDKISHNHDFRPEQTDKIYEKLYFKKYGNKKYYADSPSTEQQQYIKGFMPKNIGKKVYNEITSNKDLDAFIIDENRKKQEHVVTYDWGEPYSTLHTYYSELFVIKSINPTVARIMKRDCIELNFWDKKIGRNTLLLPTLIKLLEKYKN